MKITEKLLKAEKEGRTYWSFEFFPPRTAQGLQNLYDRIERMRNLGPEFIDITWCVSELCAELPPCWEKNGMRGSEASNELDARPDRSRTKPWQASRTSIEKG